MMFKVTSRKREEVRIYWLQGKGERIFSLGIYNSMSHKGQRLFLMVYGLYSNNSRLIDCEIEVSVK